MVERDDIPQKYLLENSEEPRNDSEEGAKVRFREDDLSGETKQRIGEYFRQNYEEETKQSIAQIDYRPNLEAFGDSSRSENSFVEKLDSGQAEEARNSFENQSRSTTFDRDVIPGNQGELDTEEEVQASILLGQLRTDPTPVADEVQRRIKENASFSPGQQYISDPNNPDDTSVEETVAGTRRHLIQPRLGAHGPKKLFGQVEVEEGVTPTLTIEQLQNLGCQILLESSGEVYIPEDPSDIAQALAARASTAAVPGLARLGFRVDANRFSAAQVIRSNVDEDIVKPSVDTELDSNARPSFGSFNNQFVPFAAISSGFSSVIVGTLLSITFSEIFILLADLLKNELGFKNSVPLAPIGANEQPENSSNQFRRRRLGSYVPKELNDEQGNLEEFGYALAGLSNIDLLIETQFDYKDALQAGVKVFFGIDNSDFLPGVAGTATRIAETPGYYIGILRSLVRSVLDPLESIVGGVAGLAGGAGPTALTRGPTDVNPIIGPDSDPTNLIGIVNVVKESKFLKFMNVLAAIGDLALKTDGNRLQSTIDSIQDTIENPLFNQIDGEPGQIVNPAALHKKSRLSDQVVDGNHKGGLAWASNTARSMFLVNSKLLNAQDLYAPNLPGWNSVAASNKNTKTRTTRRFTQTEVNLMERELDAYYVPFYFHDLRTNEIVNFHAFLDTVSDTYDVEYNDSDGYGRIGKVHTYKNTNRTIQLAFKVVSTNPNDFSEMWYKINKLTMMVFPQYTLGRSISFNSQKFIQPFSQIPAASPMIRLRVGDLIKSNFSDFDLARMFGVGSENFQLSEQAREVDAGRRAQIQQAVRQVRSEHENYNFQQGDFFIWADSVEQIGSTAERSNSSRIVQKVETEENRRAITADRRRRRGRLRRDRRRPPDIPVGSRARVEDASRANERIYTVRFVPPLPGSEGGDSYLVDFSGQEPGKVRPDPISVLDTARSRAAAGQQSTADDPFADLNNENIVKDFFAASDSEVQGNLTSQGNPIVKSFESTRGQGLAGFIKNIAFNWDGALWETEGLNNRAPKWCTINITFAPVFDINPGLDVNGNMIGAPFNVGSILQQVKINRRRENDEVANLVRYTSQARPSNNEDEPIDPGTDPTNIIG